MADDEASGAENMTDEDKLLLKHRKEKKELQAQVQKLKHSVTKGDKKKKKEITAQIAILEAELEQKHEQELQQFQQDVTNVTDCMNALATDDAKGDQQMAAAAAEDASSSEAIKGKKSSKAQRRRDQKASKNKERDEEIRKQEVHNLQGSRHKEAQTLKAKLIQRSLAIFEIPSDGNCLYAAVVDQLRRQGTEDSIDNLRHKTASYMRANRDNFLPFLCKADTGDPYSEEEFEAYCLELESSPAWGGQLEINALSHVLQHPIEVVQADAPSVTSGDEYNSQSLILTYHRHTYSLGEHYNSVQPKPQEDAEEDAFT